MLSDGESKAFDSVVEAQLYGDDVTIGKEECINHVPERMQSPKGPYLRKGEADSSKNAQNSKVSWTGN